MNASKLQLLLYFEFDRGISVSVYALSFQDGDYPPPPPLGRSPLARPLLFIRLPDINLLLVCQCVDIYREKVAHFTDRQFCL